MTNDFTLIVKYFNGIKVPLEVIGDVRIETYLGADTTYIHAMVSKEAVETLPKEDWIKSIYVEDFAYDHESLVCKRANGIMGIELEMVEVGDAVELTFIYHERTHECIIHPNADGYMGYLVEYINQDEPDIISLFELHQTNGNIIVGRFRIYVHGGWEYNRVEITEGQDYNNRITEFIINSYFEDGDERYDASTIRRELQSIEEVN